jgi:WD40 repeat protein
MIEGDLTSPFVHFYNSSLTKLADPATLPSAGVQAVALSPDKKTAAVATATAIFIYDLTSGAPVKVTGIASPPSWVNITAVRFSPDSSKLLVTDNTASPFVWVYNTSTWVLTTTPSVGAVGGVQNGCFSPDGTKIALCLGGGTFLSIYNVSTGVITTGPTGTALPSTTCRGISWSPDGSKLAVATGASEFICYRTDTWAQITVSPQPSGAVAGLPDTCAFSPGSDRLVFCIGSSPWLVSFTISGNTLTAEAAPATTPTAQGRAVSFSSDGTKAFIGNAGTTKLMTYNIPGWTRATDAGTQPAGNPFDVFCLF